MFTNNVSDKYDACFKDNVDQVANSVFNDSFSEIGDNGIVKFDIKYQNIIKNKIFINFYFTLRIFTLKEK